MEPEVTKSKREPEGAPLANGTAPLPSRAAAPAVAPGADAGSQAAPAKKSRRGYFIVLGLASAIGLGVGGYTLLTAGEESTDDAQVGADVVPVGLRVGGLVTKVFIQDNQLVKKGDPLAEVDDADYLAREKQAEAELATADAQANAADAQVQVVEATSKGGLASAKAMLSGSSAGVGSAVAQAESAKAALDRAEVDAKKAKLDLDRTKELRAENAISQQTLDNAQALYDSAAAAVAQAKAQLAVASQARATALAQVGEAQGKLSQSTPVDAQIAEARAQAQLAHAKYDSAKAQLDLAKLQLSYTKVMSPADGFASRLTVHPGQLVTIGQPVVQLVPTLTYVVANFKETQLGKMRAGQAAEMTVDAYGSRKFKGKVESISGGTGASFSLLPADNATGNFVKVVQRVPVRIAWEGLPADVPMRAGLSADVTVDVGK
jgi:membrane fusion protein (multidrug efflux system)